MKFFSLVCLVSLVTEAPGQSIPTPRLSGPRMLPILVSGPANSRAPELNFAPAVNSGNVAVLLGNGNGTFQQAVTTPRAGRFLFR